VERKLPGEAVERQAIHGTFPRRLRLGRDRRKLEAESENDPAPPWSVRVKRESVAAIARARPPASAALLAGPLLDGCHEPLVLATLVRQTGPVIGICDSRGASRNQVRFLNATDPLVCVVAPAG
jgi:hypothetical protein